MNSDFLKKRDRLLLIGDSITEARRYSRILESYLLACNPELSVEVRNLGKGGETAAGFLLRMDADCIPLKGTVATVFYGMNDTGYIADNYDAAKSHRKALEQIVDKLLDQGLRVVISTAGYFGRVPPWQFVLDAGASQSGLNNTIRAIRDEAVDLARSRGLVCFDQYSSLESACRLSLERYGPDYGICGLDDGVHPSWAGHLVMAWGFFKALGLDGSLGSLRIDLASKTGTATRGHAFQGLRGEDFSFVSDRYPFCAEGPADKDWSIRSGMTLVPFNQDFNRFILQVAGMKAARYRVAWMNQHSVLEEWHDYSAAELEAGVNLAADFQRNPFSEHFNRVQDLIYQKQGAESEMTWHSWDQQGIPRAEGLHHLETRRADLLAAAGRAFVPVTHNLRIEARP